MATTEDSAHAPTIGEVAVGPGRYRRVVLDRVLITGHEGSYVMAGTDSRIQVSASSITACASEFWKAMFSLVGEMEAGMRPSFTKTNDAFNEFFRVMGQRVLLVVEEPPSDGADVELEIEFWEGQCPPEMNTKRVHLGGEVPF